jgi:hypothetical protein
VLVGLRHTPDNDGGVKGAASDHGRVRRPSDSVDTGCVESPLLVVGKLDQRNITFKSFQKTMIKISILLENEKNNPN